MIFALTALLLPAVAAWWVLRALRLSVPGGSGVLTAAVAGALGIGAASLVTFAAVSAGVFPGRVFVGADASLWLGIWLGAWLSARAHASKAAAGSRIERARRWTAADWLVRAGCIAVLAAACAVPVIEYLRSPHGQWDAWAIWNQKARFLFRAGEDWTASRFIPWSQPGHPLLVPLSVARLWAYAGAELTAAPALLSGVFGALTVATVMGALDVSRTRAWVAGSVLVAPLTFSNLVAAQTADLPMAMFMVASLAMLRQDDAAAWRQPGRARSALFLAGALAGLSAWTKNEGALFVAASGCLVVWVVVRHGRWQDAGWWIGGVAPMAAFVGYFKLVLLPVVPEYVAGTTGAGLMGQMISSDRHAAVLALLLPMWLSWGGPLARGCLPVAMAAALLLSLVPHGRSGRGTLAVVAVMMAGYYIVYLLTPLNVSWMVATSSERLVMQVWPALVMAALSVGHIGAQDSAPTAFARGDT